MGDIKKIKSIFISIGGVATSLLGILAIPVLLLVSCNVIDYITGIVAAKYREQHINSYKGIRGITKKVCMWLLVAVGAIIDELLIYAASVINITPPVTFLIACIVAVWLTCNELISILENINDIGVALPPFLIGIVSQLKSQVEDKADIKADVESDAAADKEDKHDGNNKISDE